MSTTSRTTSSQEDEKALIGAAAHVRMAQRAAGWTRPELSADFNARATKQLMAALKDSQPRSRVRALVLTGMPLLAIAAALLVWLRTPSESALTHYTGELQGALALTRSPTDEGRVNLAPGIPVVVVLRPEEPTRSSVTTKAYIQADNDAAFELASQSEHAATGAVRVTLELPTNLPRAGTLVLLVGRAPELTLDRARSQDSSGPGWQRVAWPFTSEDKLDDNGGRK